MLGTGLGSGAGGGLRATFAGGVAVIEVGA
jgi:hypothetical protein